jgi:hypothetical protein
MRAEKAGTAGHKNPFEAGHGDSNDGLKVDDPAAKVCGDEQRMSRAGVLYNNLDALLMTLPLHRASRFGCFDIESLPYRRRPNYNGCETLPARIQIMKCGRIARNPRVYQRITCHAGVFFRGLCFGLLVLTVRPTPAEEHQSAVSLTTLLAEMTDRDAAAKWPEPAFTLKESSSHDRRKTNPADAATWHSNDDHDQFIRTEVNGGRREWVIMDHDGPGAITRFWIPLLADKDKQIVRFYFDGSATPAIAVNFNELLSGKLFVRPPLAFVAWNETDLRQELQASFKAPRGVAGDLYLPIPFAKSCKITLDQIPFYYVINYRAYAPGTRVETFTMDDYLAAKIKVAQTDKTLMAGLDPQRVVGGNQATLGPGEELKLDLNKGEFSVCNLQVEIEPKDAPQVLRSIVLEATFDDEQTIWCPLGEFFGCGARLHAVRDWCRTVDEDGKLSASWIMPYERSGRLALKNVGTKRVTVKLGAQVLPWKWDDRSMHFHANWHCQLGMKTRPMFDWNYLEIEGRAKYVGDTLTVYSPVPEWYGEGDERIYLNGERVASQIGTGTEDYYGYAWGMANFFNSPFLSAPERDTSGRDSWKGYTTTSRLRLLDSIPVETSLKHDMEIWNWADTKVDYAVGLFWYGRPGVKHNRLPQPDEAAQPLKEAPPDPARYKIPAALECEALPIIARSPGLPSEIQGSGLREGMWSGGQQLFVRANKVGDYLELSIPDKATGKRKVTLYGTKAPDYGILKFSINGQPAGPAYDAYHPVAIASGPIELGTFEPKDGKLLLRVEVVGTNRAAIGSRYFFGLDCVTLKAE